MPKTQCDQVKLQAVGTLTTTTTLAYELLQKKKFNITRFFKLKNPFNITVNC
jgi:hypothetical protein